MIEILKLNKVYDNQVIYKDFNLTLWPHTTTCLMGASGCGKTTLLRILAGLETYESGVIRGIHQKRIAYVFQEDRLMPWMSVGENIHYVLGGINSREERDEKVHYFLKMMALENYVGASIGQLSGGMQRRVAIARALAYNSDILLLDEPFKGLDERLKWKILESIVGYLKTSTCTTVCVTHELEVACYLGEIVDVERRKKER